MSELATEQIDFQQEIENEMKAAATQKVMNKLLLTELSNINFSKSNSHLLDVTGKGETIHFTIYWQHYIVELHSKDSDTVIQTNQTKQNEYVKNVNVKAIKIPIEKIIASNLTNTNKEIYFKSFELNTISPGTLISVGKIKRTMSKDDLLNDDGKGLISFPCFNQNNPTIIIPHYDSKDHTVKNMNAILGEYYDEYLSKYSAGFWNLLWAVPLLFGFFLGVYGIMLLIIGVVAFGFIGFSRMRKLDKRREDTNKWIGDQMLDIVDTVESLKIKIKAKLSK
jgi:hypothetical protein